MFTSGDGSNGLAVVVDARSKLCKETNTVLDLSNWRRFLGKEEWNRTLKIALRDYGTEPHTSYDVLSLRREVGACLHERNVRCVIVMQSPAIPNVRQTHTAFAALGPGGSPYKWAGTVWHHDMRGPFIAPILNPSNYEDVYEYLIRRWFQQAHAVARGTIKPMPWPTLITEAGDEMAEGMEALSKTTRPIAIDIETNMSRTIITAIGFSDGVHTVSVPWHGYHISGTDDEEPSLRSLRMGRDIEALALKVMASDQPKILHNGAFDVYELAQHGIELRGFEYDTLLLHRVCYPQFRHGLNQACATEFCVEPWKNIWKAPAAVRGTGEDIWLSDPREMRRYNARDSFATWQLFNYLRKRVGI